MDRETLEFQGRFLCVPPLEEDKVADLRKILETRKDGLGEAELAYEADSASPFEVIPKESIDGAVSAGSFEPQGEAELFPWGHESVFRE